MKIRCPDEAQSFKNEVLAFSKNLIASGFLRSALKKCYRHTCRKFRPTCGTQPEAVAK